MHKRFKHDTSIGAEPLAKKEKSYSVSSVPATRTGTNPADFSMFFRANGP